MNAKTSNVQLMSVQIRSDKALNVSFTKFVSLYEYLLSVYVLVTSFTNRVRNMFANIVKGFDFYTTTTTMSEPSPIYAR